MMHAQSEPTANVINPKCFVGAKPHTYQGNLWQLHPALVKRLVPLPNFVNWKWELNEQRTAWTKVPYQPGNPTWKAATDNKRTWGTYDDAVANVVAGKADGIGFCLFETNICAFDIDNCRDLVTGKVDPIALELIARCGKTYAEKTVSGTGLRIIGLGGAKYVNRKQPVVGSTVSIESYRYCSRYITVSGLALDSVKPNMADLGNIDAVITDVVAELDLSNGTAPDPGAAGPGATDKERKGDEANSDKVDLDGKINPFIEASLPAKLMELIRDGVPAPGRSDGFFHAVQWLKKDLNWSLNDIIALLEQYPDGIASKYVADNRVAAEATRAYGKPGKEKPDLGQSSQDSASAGAGPSTRPGTSQSAASGGSQATPHPRQWLDMSNWDNEPIPTRQWAIPDRVPLNQVGLFSGEGGAGKSIIEIMKGVAHVAAKDWLGERPEQGGAFYLGAEDDTDELHIRLAVIARYYGASFEELIAGGLCVLPLLGEDAVLCAVNPRSGRVETTELFDWVLERAGDLKPKNISVDTLSRAFAGDEINRAQVYAFAMYMQKLAKAASGSVTVLSHPSLQGINSGSGLSGSTAWHGAFRFRQYLKGVKAAGEAEANDSATEPDNGLRLLEFKKNQYGPLGASIALRYKDGLFLPEFGLSDADRAIQNALARQVFVHLLERFTEQGRNASHAPTANNYAPAVFAKETKAKSLRLRKADFEDVLRDLFATGQVVVENYGRPSRPMTRLALRPTPPSEDSAKG